MDSLSELLKSNRPAEPPQIKALKEYVKKFHDEPAQARVGQLGYSLTVPNSSLASNLQMEMPKIVEYCNLDKKLFIRIGHF